MNNAILLILLGVVLLLVLFFLSFSSLQQIVRIRRTPAGYITSFSYEGQVKVSGKAGPAVGKSSITNTDCAFYEVEVEERRGGRNHYWVTLKKIASSQPFEVQDETSRIGVLPEGASLVLKHDIQKYTGLFTQLDPPILDAVESLGVETTGALKIRKTLRVTERRIEPGEDVFVLGQLKMVDGRRQIAAVQKGSLIISDRGEEQLLRWLYLQVVLRLVLIPAGVVLVGWLIFRSW